MSIVGVLVSLCHKLSDKRINLFIKVKSDVSSDEVSEAESDESADSDSDAEPVKKGNKGWTDDEWSSSDNDSDSSSDDEVPPPAEEGDSEFAR
jgi:hypothetical protein